MWWITVISTALRLFGFIQWAEAWEQRHKERQGEDVETSINRMSDADVDRELRSEFTARK